MFRLLALSTAFMLALFVSVPGDINPRADDGVSYTALADDNAYTKQKQEEKKFLPGKDISTTTDRAVYFSATPHLSVAIFEPATLNIRGPPATPALA